VSEAQAPWRGLSNSTENVEEALHNELASPHSAIQCDGFQAQLPGVGDNQVRSFARREMAARSVHRFGFMAWPGSGSIIRRLRVAHDVAVGRSAVIKRLSISQNEQHAPQVRGVARALQLWASPTHREVSMHYV